MPADVFVTAVGIVSPLGSDTAATWSGLIAGRRAVRAYEVPTQPGWILPAAPAFDLPAADRTPRAVEFILRASKEVRCGAATQDRNDTRAVHSNNPLNTLISISSSKMLLDDVEPYSLTITPDLYTIHQFCIPSLNVSVDAPARAVMAMCGGASGVLAPVAACAGGTHAVIRAAQAIADGDAETALAGGTDASLHPLWLACYDRLGVLAPAHPELGPGWTCRPFDVSRGGFAVGEGAAVLRLGSAESIKRWGGRPLARLVGWALGSDPAGLTQLSDDGEPLAHVIRLACDRAGVRTSDLACIHAHGTGTEANDRVETAAIRRALGVAASSIPIVSIKGSIGHLMGAAGAVELAVAALAIRDRRSPANATLIEPDPDMEKLVFPREAFDLPPGPILKTSLGFGGHLAAVVMQPV